MSSQRPEHLGDDIIGNENEYSKCIVNTNKYLRLVIFMLIKSLLSISSFLYVSSTWYICCNECVLTSSGGIIYDSRYDRPGLVNHSVHTRWIQMNLVVDSSNRFQTFSFNGYWLKFNINNVHCWYKLATVIHHSRVQARNEPLFERKMLLRRFLHPPAFLLMDHEFVLAYLFQIYILMNVIPLHTKVPNLSSRNRPSYLEHVLSIL